MKERKVLVMDTITDTELTVYEVSKVAALKQVREWIEEIEWQEELKRIGNAYACEPDMYIYIEYEDGSTYTRSYFDENGKFKKSGKIKYIEMDDGCEYTIYGKYIMNEETNFIPQVV